MIEWSVNVGKFYLDCNEYYKLLYANNVVKLGVNITLENGGGGQKGQQFVV